MAREVLLRFGTRNLDRAKEAAKKILKAAKEAAKAIKDVDKRREALRQVREQGREDRRVINDERKAQRGDLKSQRARRRARRGFGAAGVPRFGEPGEALAKFAEGKGAQAGIDGAAQALGGGLFAAGAGAAGAAVTLLWDKFGRPFVEKKLAEIENLRIQPLLARLEEIERQSLEAIFAEGGENARGLRRAARLQAEAVDRRLRSKRFTKSSQLDRL